MNADVSKTAARIAQHIFADPGPDTTVEDEVIAWFDTQQQRLAELQKASMAAQQVPDLPSWALALMEQGPTATPQATQPPHEHRFVGVEQRCMTCGCGRPFDDHGLPQPVLEGEPHTGCMVAFLLPGHLSQMLAVPGGEAAQDLHITLAFLGDTTQKDIDLDELQRIVKAWAAEEAPIPIRISGIGRFNGKGGQDAVYASVDSEALRSARERLMQRFEGTSLTPSTDFGYTPHITLCYIPSDEPTPDIRVPSVEAKLTYAWVCYQDRRYAYELAGAAEERVATADVLRAMRAEIQQAITAEY